MLYRIIKPLALNAMSHFFSEVVYRGTPQEKGPLIVTANHPSVVLDGLLVVGNYKRDICFTVKSTVFMGAWINWFWKWLHFIPVYRKQDNPEESHRNQEAFRFVSRKLAQDCAVLIFPEGESFAVRHLGRIKTGAARIALQAESDSDFQLGLRIQPVGITYSDFFRFNSSVTVASGKPIEVSSYKEEYLNDAEQAARNLTAEIERHLKELTVEVAKVDDADLIEMLEKLYHSQEVSWDDQSRLKMVKEKLRDLPIRENRRLQELKRRLALYLELVESLKLPTTERLYTRRSKLFVALISPFIIIGLVTLFIPFKLSYAIGQRMMRKSAHYSSWAFSVAFVLFPIWELLLGCAVYWFTGSLSVAALSIFVLIGSGYFTSKYFNRFALYIFSMLWPGKTSPVDVVEKMRDELVFEFEKLCSEA